MPEAPPPLPKSQPSFTRRHSTILKLAGVGALILLLLIPLAMIEGVLSDRLARRNEAVNDITASWGKDQNIIWPVLCLLHQFHGKVVRAVTLPDCKGESRGIKAATVANAFFPPDRVS